jgi:sugar lactone lactonase YvrE
MSAGDIYTVAGDGTSGYLGDGGPATAAELTFPDGVAVDAGGNLVVADTDNEVVRVVASATGVFYGQAMTAGDIYTIAGNGTFGSTGDGGPATAAELKFPDGLAIDGSGNVLLADSGNHRIRVVAVATGTFYQQAMTAGDIYTIAGTGKRGFSGNRSLATAAKLAVPNGVVLDSSGNVVIADSANNQIRVVAEHTGTFFGVAMKTGNIYPVAGSSNKPGFAGDGGAGTSGKLDYPYGEAVDASGDLFFADLLNSRVRELAGP